MWNPSEINCRVLEICWTFVVTVRHRLQSPIPTEVAWHKDVEGWVGLRRDVGIRTQSTPRKWCWGVIGRPCSYFQNGWRTVESDLTLDLPPHDLSIAQHKSDTKSQLTFVSAGLVRFQYLRAENYEGFPFLAKPISQPMRPLEQGGIPGILELWLKCCETLWPNELEMDSWLPDLRSWHEFGPRRDWLRRGLLGFPERRDERVRLMWWELESKFHWGQEEGGNVMVTMGGGPPFLPCNQQKLSNQNLWKNPHIPKIPVLDYWFIFNVGFL